MTERNDGMMERALGTVKQVLWYDGMESWSGYFKKKFLQRLLKEFCLEKGLQIKRLYLRFWWNDAMEWFFDEMGVLAGDHWNSRERQNRMAGKKGRRQRFGDKK